MAMVGTVVRRHGTAARHGGTARRHGGYRPAAPGQPV